MSSHNEHIVLILPLCLLLSVPIRLLIKKVHAPIPENIFLLAAAILIGGTIALVESLRSYRSVFNLAPVNTMLVFLPIFTMSTIYRMEYYTFFRCLPQVIIIILLIVLFSPMLIAVFFSYFLYTDMSFMHGVIIALTTIPIQPTNIIGILRELADHKFLATILEAESVLLLIPTYLVFQLLIGAQHQLQTEWYQFVIVIIRHLVGGFIVGCILGMMQARFICWFYNEPVAAVCISISMLYFTFFTAEYVFNVSSLLAITCCSCIVAMKKHRFTCEVDAALTCFWGILLHVADIGILMLLTIRLTIDAVDAFNFFDVYGVIIFYFTGFFVRWISLLLISPIISRMTYNLNLKCLLVLSWSNVKGSINVNMLLTILADPVIGVVDPYIFELLVYVFASVAVNTITMKMLLKFIGFSDMSPSRLANMNNCIKYIVEKRSTIINILKMDRYLTNANWNRVRKETIIRHPYIANKTVTQVDEEVAVWEEDNAIFCPDCHNMVPYDISEKEMAALLNETRLKILRSKKVSIIKQYRNGTIDKNSLQVLIHHLETMIESKRHNNNLQLQKYLKASYVVRTLRYLVMKWCKQYHFTPSTKFIRRLCFYTTMHVGYDFSMYVVMMGNALMSICGPQYVSNHTMFVYHSVMWAIFLLEFLVKLIGFSKKSLFISGLKHYFSIYWNTFDFLLIFLGAHNFFLATEANVSDWLIYHSVLTFRSIAVVRLLHILHLMNIFCPHVLRTINYHVDKRMCFVFDLATSMMDCDTELIENLGQVIEIKTLRDLFRNELIAERDALLTIVDTIQKEHPHIAVTVKTKQAIRTTLANMDETLAQLLVSGFLDKIEYSIINKHLVEKQKFLRNLKLVEPSPPRIIFKEVPWMDDDDVLIDFLYKHVKIVEWNAGEVIVQHGELSGGIYIIVTGMLRMRYRPSKDWDDYTYIPIVDNLSVVDYGQKCDGTFIAGSTIGELCVLTGRAYDCSISAESPSQAYFLSATLLKKAMEMHANPVTGLKARMWKSAVSSLAVAILMEVPLYRLQTQEQIKFKLQRSFVPNINCYKVFVMTELMDDVLLIEGVVADYVTGEVFKAPMLIPRATQKLMLKKRSAVNATENSRPRLLIVPAGNTTDLHIMENEEEIAELVSRPASKCLLHSERIADRIKRWQHPLPVLSKLSDNMLEYVWSEDKELINLDSHEYVQRFSTFPRFSRVSEREQSTFLLRNKHIYSSYDRSYDTEPSTPDRY